MKSSCSNLTWGSKVVPDFFELSLHTRLYSVPEANMWSINIAFVINLKGHCIHISCIFHVYLMYIFHVYFTVAIWKSWNTRVRYVYGWHTDDIYTHWNLAIVDLILDHRLRRWPNNKAKLGRRLAFAGLNLWLNPAESMRWIDVSLTLVHRIRCRTNVKPKVI